MTADFVFIDEAVPGVRWDARYATWANFTGKPVDGYEVNRVVGSTAMCAALSVAKAAAAASGFGLLLWDGYRPQRAVDAFLRWSTEPEDGSTKRANYPRIDKAQMFDIGYVAARSGHSRGSAIDLTIYDLASGALVPMGGDHDLMDLISHHGATGITRDDSRGRDELRSIMEAAGFLAYELEWWHYSLRDEPYPDTYFDFPIDDSLANRG